MNTLELAKVQTNHLGQEAQRLHSEITALQKFTLPISPQLREKQDRLANVLEAYCRAREEQDRLANNCPQCPGCGSSKVRKQGTGTRSSFHCNDCRRSFNNDADPVWHQPSETVPAQPRRKILKPGQVEAVASNLPLVSRETGREL